MPDDLLATAIEAAGRSKALEYAVQPNRRLSKARFVTGAAIPIDGGATAPFKLLTANPESTSSSR